MKKTVHVVGAIIENEKNEIFCALRAPNMSLPDYWEFPGGKLEAGEAPKQTLIREIQEELTCQISVGEKVEDTTYEYDNIIVRLETYKATITTGQPTALEHAATAWVPRNKLHQLKFAPADIPAVERLLKEQ